MTQVNNFIKKYNDLNFTDLHTLFDDLRNDIYYEKEGDLEELEAVRQLMVEWKRLEIFFLIIIRRNL
ncbi:hypothetical protein LCGC14_1781770 [marine sediment metagenome]|uniref:Uncharacterized protein n=1 Tax=marine sediment metagenome TaxID=412755 RepID=A0A0F9JA40_9ZZZZ